MNNVIDPDSASARSKQSPVSGQATTYPIPLMGWRISRTTAVAIITLLSGVVAWAMGQELSKRIDEQERQVRSRRQPPAPGAPPTSKTVDNNNTIMRLGFMVDLDGMAIGYTGEAGNLVSNGHFQIDLPLEEMANRLHITAKAIANPRSPGEIDPDAELFRAQAGTLTERCREVLKKARREMVRAGKMPSYGSSEWVVKDFSFTLNRLKNPTVEEKVILAAIARAAAETMPQPGDKVRAVGESRGNLEHGETVLTPGMLPLEAQDKTSERALQAHREDH
jgi:hypothetical protein